MSVRRREREGRRAVPRWRWRAHLVALVGFVAGAASCGNIAGLSDYVTSSVDASSPEIEGLSDAPSSGSDGPDTSDSNDAGGETEGADDAAGDAAGDGLGMTGHCDAATCADGASMNGGCPVGGFGYAPANFAPDAYTPPTSATIIDCATSYSATTHAFTDWCAGRTQPVVMSGVTQDGGPKVDVLAFAGLTMTTDGVLTLTGGNAVVLAVYGDAVIAGAIHADGAGGASGTSATGASGPGGNYNCAGSTGSSQPLDGHTSGGAGGGGEAAGGNGAGGVGGNTAAGGVARANASLSPLYGGCPGGTSGSWACQTSGGGGGGALQISAAGALSVGGSVTASGGAGGSSTCFAAGCGAGGYGGGGGGGGSGGAILLEGHPVVTAGSTLTVNGGRGGDPNIKRDGGALDAGQGGAGGTLSSPAGLAGSGYTSDGCGSFTQCGGGGGGGYGYLVVNQASGAGPSCNGTCTDAGCEAIADASGP